MLVFEVSERLAELSAVVNLTFLFRGLPAANLGAQIIQEIADNEAKEKISADG